MSHENGRVFADKGDIERLDRRIDDHAEVTQRRIGELEATWIRLEGHFEAVRRATAGIGTDVNNLRHHLDLRLDSFESLIKSLLQVKAP